MGTHRVRYQRGTHLSLQQNAQKLSTSDAGGKEHLVKDAAATWFYICSVKANILPCTDKKVVKILHLPIILTTMNIKILDERGNLNIGHGALALYQVANVVNQLLPDQKLIKTIKLPDGKTLDECLENYQGRDATSSMGSESKLNLIHVENTEEHVRRSMPEDSGKKWDEEGKGWGEGSRPHEGGGLGDVEKVMAKDWVFRELYLVTKRCFLSSPMCYLSTPSGSLVVIEIQHLLLPSAEKLLYPVSLLPFWITFRLS